jgi:hypothetical protein
VAFVLDFSHFLIKIQNIVPIRSFRERLRPPPKVKMGGGPYSVWPCFAFLLTSRHHCPVLQHITSLPFDLKTSRPSFAAHHHSSFSPQDITAQFCSTSPLFLLTSRHHGPVLQHITTLPFDLKTLRPSFAAHYHSSFWPQDITTQFCSTSPVFLLTSRHHGPVLQHITTLPFDLKTSRPSFAAHHHSSERRVLLIIIIF